MNLLDTGLINEKLTRAKELLIKHNRTDLKIVAVNKYYDTCVCEDENGHLTHYLITNSKVRREQPVSRYFGPNYILVDFEYEHFEAVELIKGRSYTCCARSELDSYLEKGWEIERRR